MRCRGRHTPRMPGRSTTVAPCARRAVVLGCRPSSVADPCPSGSGCAAVIFSPLTLRGHGPRRPLRRHLVACRVPDVDDDEGPAVAGLGGLSAVSEGRHGYICTRLSRGQPSDGDMTRLDRPVPPNLLAGTWAH